MLYKVEDGKEVMNIEWAGIWKEAYFETLPGNHV
jgi:hypothetical protein